jgi:hypothetical protein
MRKIFALSIFLLFFVAKAWGATYNIGPGQTYATFAAFHAAVTVKAGDIVDGGGRVFYERVVPNGPAIYRNFTLDGTVSYDGTYSNSGGNYVTGYAWTQVGTTEIYQKTMSRGTFQFFEDGVLLTPVVTTAALTSNDDLARGRYSYYSGGSRLYYRATDGAAPSTHTLRGSARLYDSYTGLLYISGINGLTLENVTVRYHCPNAVISVAVYIVNSSNIALKSVTVSYSVAGISFNNVSNSSVDVNSSVNNHYTEGLRVEGNSNNLIFQGNYSYNGRAKYYNGVAIKYIPDGDGIGIGGIGGTMTNIRIDRAVVSYNGAADGDQVVGGQDYGAGIYLGTAYSMTAGVSITNSHIYKNHTAGIFLDGDQWSGGTIAYNVIRDNLNYGTADTINAVHAGCNSASFTSANIWNNAIARNYGQGGMYLNCPGKTVSIRNNIFYNNGRTGTFQGDLWLGFSTLTNLTESNNLFYRSGTGWDSARVINRGGTPYDRNHIVGTSAGYWQYDSGKGANDKASDPLWVSGAANNFNLLAGSPARDAGTNVGLTADFLGKPVPYGSAPDIGAYEYTSSPLKIPNYPPITIN